MAEEQNLEGKEKKTTKKSPLREWFDSVLFAVVAATLIRWLLLEAYTIPTGSMERSLLVNDFLFVSKTAYGIFPRAAQQGAARSAWPGPKVLP